MIEPIQELMTDVRLSLRLAPWEVPGRSREQTLEVELGDPYLSSVRRQAGALGVLYRAVVEDLNS